MRTRLDVTLYVHCLSCSIYVHQGFASSSSSVIAAAVDCEISKVSVDIVYYIKGKGHPATGQGGSRGSG
jgi:hypothetical protein